MGGFYFDSDARSALGLVRNGNEDSAFVSGRLIAVADGMGGHAGGEVASRIAIRTLQSMAPMLTDETIDSDSAHDLLINSLHTIDTEIGDYSREAIELRGMGTTLTALVIHNDSIALLHVGDSRCYRLRGNTIEQLSNDHTVIQELLSQGAITITEALDHPQRSVLTQALMGEGNLVPVLQLFDAKEGDRYLLCSDGLSSVLTEKEIKLLLKKRDRKAAIKALIDAAYIQGAPDNITALIADITREEVITNEFLGAAL
ncbi:MAG: protein phosphatase 2C domain-containing protein [Candidatus Planktophila sp.]|nr:protein phosphatase 2C domain-containing protein [Candidatus Planktophila sp.]